MGFPGGSVIKNFPASAGLIRGLGRFPGEGNGKPRQYSYLENPMDEEPDGLPSVGLQKSWT